MIRFSVTLFALLLLSPMTVQPALSGDEASSRLTVIELFTSQGCSSCPPADHFLQKLADEPGILALSWSVDYWDYLGWRDTFARPEFTARQKAYNHALGKSGVYTPQMVIAGRYEVVGSRKDDVRDLIAQSREDNPAVAIGLERDRALLRAFPLSGEITRPLTVWLVGFDDRRDVVIRAGELKGRTMTYRNVVSEAKDIGTLSPGTGGFELNMENIEGIRGNRHAILFQQGAGGPIVAAHRITIP